MNHGAWILILQLWCLLSDINMKSCGSDELELSDYIKMGIIVFQKGIF